MKFAIISPAGIVDKDNCKKGAAFFTDRNINLAYGKNLYKQERWTAGSVKQRCDDLLEAWASDADAVLCARGGFGSIQLLDSLPWQELKNIDNVLCGHSDITALHLAFLKKGVGCSVSGSMPTVEFAKSPDELTTNSFFQALKFQLPDDLDACLSSCEVIQEGQCRGQLVPVTLSVMCSLLGTGYMPDLEGDVLVVEDVNESPYRLDAYLSQLCLSGILSKLGGLVFGDFSDCGNEQDKKFLFEKYGALVKGPVISGLPFGHCLPRLSLPVGLGVCFSVNQEITIESINGRR